MPYDDPPPAPLPRPLDLAVQALGEWRTFGRSPREALSRVMPPELPAAARAELAATVYGTIRDERRLEFALGGARGLPFEGGARDAALLLAYRVAAGEVSPEAAAERMAAWTPARVPFASVHDFGRSVGSVADPVERFGITHSVPDWIARMLMAEFGDSAAALASALRSDPPRVVRTNLLRSTREELAALLTAARIATAPCRYSRTGLEVHGDSGLFALDAYEQGRFEQQDEGSQLVAELTAPPPRGKVLDACAGSGGKTLAIAALLQNRGTVLACDVHERRLAELRPRAARAGAQNVQWAAVAEDAWPPAVATFAQAADRILLDVPCSGIGAWRRRPEGRWSLQPTALATLHAAQAELLDRAARALKPGARIVYATCTLLRAENEAQIEGALARHASLELVRAREVLGGELASKVCEASGAYLSLRPDVHGTDGFFAAVLRRKRAP